MAPLRPERRDDVLALFDAAPAPARGARERAACCCTLYALPRAVDFAALDASAHRCATASRIDVGEQDGYLALDAGRVAAWLNVQPRHRVPHCFDRLGIAPPPIDVPPHDAAVALCLVVAPGVDAAAVGPALIAAAVDALAARGLRVVEAFPRRDAAGDEAHEPGRPGWYEAAGFVVEGERGGRLHMRRGLA
ncbi:MAG TPA: hypothetical protein VFX05_12915 [Casimicrobiaceae bacterium]|nr:hypothetical protein [Casimicrobiaceae bacterium]